MGEPNWSPSQSPSRSSPSRASRSRSPPSQRGIDRGAARPRARSLSDDEAAKGSFLGVVLDFTKKWRSIARAVEGGSVEELRSLTARPARAGFKPGDLPVHIGMTTGAPRDPASREESERIRSDGLMAHFEGAPDESITLCEHRRGGSPGVVDALTPFQRASGEIIGPGRGRRLIVIASPGSGKTCAMLQVAMQYVDKICPDAEDRDEPGMRGFYNIVVIGDANVKQNLEKELARCPVVYAGVQDALRGALLRDLNRRRDEGPPQEHARDDDRGAGAPLRNDEFLGEDGSFGAEHLELLDVLPGLRRDVVLEAAGARRKPPARARAPWSAWCTLRSECTGKKIPGTPPCKSGEVAMKSCWFVFTLEELGNVLKTFDPASTKKFQKYAPHLVLDPNSPRNVFLIDEAHLLVDTLHESSGGKSAWRGSVLTVANWLRSLNPDDGTSPTVVGFTATMSDPICMATLFKGMSSDAVDEASRLRVDPKAFLAPSNGFVEEIEEIAVVAEDGSSELLPTSVLAEAVASRGCLGKRKKASERRAPDGLPERLEDVRDAETDEDDEALFASDDDESVLRLLRRVQRERALRDKADDTEAFVCPLKSLARPLRLAGDAEKMAALRRLLSGLFFVVDASGDPRLYPQESAYRRPVRRDRLYVATIDRPPAASWRHMCNSFNPDTMAAIVDVMLERVRRRRPVEGELQRAAWLMPQKLRWLLEMICPKFKTIASDLVLGQTYAYPETSNDRVSIERVFLNGRTAIYLGAPNLGKDITSTQFSLALAFYLCSVGEWEPAFLWDVDDHGKYYDGKAKELLAGSEWQRGRPAVYVLADQHSGRASSLLKEVRTMRRRSFRRAQLGSYNLGGATTVAEPSNRNDVIILDAGQSRTIDLHRTSTIVMTQDLPDVDCEQVAGRITRSCAFQGQPRGNWRTRRVTYLYTPQGPEGQDLSCDPYLRAWHCAMGGLARELRQLVSRLSIGCSVFREYNEGGMSRPNRCGDPRGERGCIYESARRPRSGAMDRGQSDDT